MQNLFHDYVLCEKVDHGICTGHGIFSGHGAHWADLGWVLFRVTFWTCVAGCDVVLQCCGGSCSPPPPLLVAAFVSQPFYFVCPHWDLTSAPLARMRVRPQRASSTQVVLVAVIVLVVGQSTWRQLSPLFTFEGELFQDRRARRIILTSKKMRIQFGFPKVSCSLKNSRRLFE
jgi:hypothetical protein